MHRHLSLAGLLLTAPLTASCSPSTPADGGAIVIAAEGEGEG